MTIGILSTLLACLCWGFVFVVPSMIQGYSPLEIALGRFFVYGLISFGWLLIKKRHLLSKTYILLWKKAFYFGFLSTILCFSMMVVSVQYANAAVTALIFAMSPISIAFVGNWKKKEFNFDQLLFPLLFMALGIVLANLDAFTYSDKPTEQYLIGLSCAILGLFSWTWYAVSNSVLLEKQTQVSVNDWGLMMGSATLLLVCLIALFLPLISSSPERFLTLDDKFQSFLWGSLVLGTISTWLAFLFWNYGSKRLPISITGQLMIAEVVFGLVLIYFFEKRLPFFTEFLGICFMITGVVIGCKKLSKLTLKKA